MTEKMRYRRLKKSINIEIRCFFLLIFLGLCSCLSAQKIDLNKSLAPVIKNLKEEYPTLRNVPLKVEKYDIDLDHETIGIKFTKHLESIPFRGKNVKDLYDSIRANLPEPLNDYKLSIYVTNYKIEELIPNYYRGKKQQDKQRKPKELPDEEPITTNLNKPYDITKGLANKHIALWHSHGWYFEQSKDRWLWQRPYLFQVVEDSYTMSYVLPFLVPMLENAGAHVFLPKERDTQINEVIVDNDTKTGLSQYKETDGQKYKWTTIDTLGFANKQEIYYDNENPFKMGSYKKITSRKNGDASIEWIPEIPERGDYAVYVSYVTEKESVEDAHYTVYHTGGKTEFSVNQTMGGSCWIYLGTFNFERGCNDKGKVVLSNVSHENGKTITADAVRFGGGMGNIARNKIVTSKKEKPSEPRISGRARYLEGARYWLQWSGFEPNVYNLNQSKNDYKDDYMCRGEWVNALAGGSIKLPEKEGKRIPIDMSMGFHTDAGFFKTDSIVGTLSIYMTETNNGIYKNDQLRLASRDLADIVQTQIVNDIRALHRPTWSRRKLADQSYYEARVPEVPTFLLELLSHQNFEDMRYGLDPNFRFDAARAVYKGILRFLSNQYGIDYIVQPLPVTHFSCEFYSKQRNEAFLSWESAIDSLEPTADPTKYIVYTAIDDGGFDNGIITHGKNIVIPIDTAKIYRFKVAAVNDGGESLPSEILSICNMPRNQKTILIVNGFRRVSAPEDFNTDVCAGFLGKEDQGVPYMNDYSFIGEQYDFLRKSKFKSNEEAGFGGSHNNYETKKIAGNTFNYPYVHGKSIKEAGYSFISCSKDAFTSKKVPLRNIYCLDYIAGEEKECTIRREKKYRIFDDETKNVMTRYLNRGGKMFLSGAYIGSDIWLRDSICDEKDIRFAEDILRFRLRQEKASKDGKLTNFFCIRKEFKHDYNYQAQLNGEQYAVESPDAIEPVNGSLEILNFSNNMAACVAGKGKYKTIVSTIPFESFTTEESRNQFMQEILDFFNSKW